MDHHTPRGMTRSRIVWVVAVATLAIAVTAGATSAGAATPAPAGRDAAATEAKGDRLVRRFLDLLQAGDLPGLRAFLSPAFQLQRADGSFVNKAEYLKAPAKVESYEIDNLRVTRRGSVIVARYDLVIDSTINGVQQSSDPAPRLSAFTKGNDGWQIVAHANFNSPATEPAQ